MCNSLLHRNKRFLTSGQVFCQFLLKLVQNKEGYSLTLKFYFFCKIFRGRCWNEEQQMKVLKLEPYIFFEVKNLIFYDFSKIWKSNNPCDVIKSKLGQKAPKLHTIF